MAIHIKREKNERGVPVGSLALGDTFLYDNCVGVIVERKGEQFPLDLTNCREMAQAGTYPFVEKLKPDTIVLPISVELIYKVVD